MSKPRVPNNVAAAVAQMPYPDYSYLQAQIREIDIDRRSGFTYGFTGNASKTTSMVMLGGWCNEAAKWTLVAVVVSFTLKYFNLLALVGVRQ